MVALQVFSVLPISNYFDTVKPVLSSQSKRRPKIGFQDRLSLNAGQKYCRMLQWEYSAILSTFKLPFAIKTFVSSIFEWPLKTGFTVFLYQIHIPQCYCDISTIGYICFIQYM